MRSTRSLFLAAIASLLLSSCVRSNGNGSVFQHFSIRGDGVVVHSPTGSDAIVMSNGNLTIGGKPIAVTPTQRQLLQAYHGHVLDLRKDAVATGKEGGRTALHAIGAVAEGLATGNPDEIGDKVEHQAGRVEALADKVCLHLANIRTTQEAIVTVISAFKPYATVEPQQV